MTEWSDLSEEELELRRLASVEVMRTRDREEFDRWYQERCDQDYWSFGQCCAGCDHWQSDSSNLGQCAAKGIVPGDQVMASMGISFCSYTPEPGLPFTKASSWCDQFKDDFDWSSLPADYLVKIGAHQNGKMKPKPSSVRTLEMY